MASAAGVAVDVGLIGRIQRSLVAALHSALYHSTLIVVASVVVWLATLVLVQRSPILQTPDETANRLIVQTFSSTGKLWYENDMLAADDENLLHPRGLLTHEGRAVPFNYLGLPLTYGALYTVFGPGLWWIAIVLSGTTTFFLYRGAKELFGASLLDVLIALAATTPVLYYFNRPFMNALPTITMVSLGGWLLVCYYRRSQRNYLLFASLAFAAAMLFRYEYALFLLGLVVVVLVHKHRTLRAKPFWRDAGLFLVIAACFFLAPVLALNRYVYGDWTTYGYGLFNDYYFPERSAQDSAAFHANIWRTARGMLFPSYPFDLAATLRNSLRFIVFLTPLLSGAAAAGLATLMVRRAIPWRFVIPYVALALYVLVYRGSADTWGADGYEPTFNAAIVRYWLPLYLAMFALAAFTLRELKWLMLKVLLGVAMVGSGALTLGLVTDGNLTQLRRELDNEVAWTRAVLLPSTEPDAIVYSGRTDKRIAPYRYSAAWWNGEQFYEPALVASSMAKAFETGRPIYIVVEREVKLDALNEELAPYGLRARDAERATLSRIERLP